MKCLLDKEKFECCKCHKEFKHTEGTWLPIGIEDSKFMKTISKDEHTTVCAWNLQPPEIITDDKFTCYDCL